LSSTFKPLRIEDVKSFRVQRAAELGTIYPGWALEDYMRHEINRGGWMSIADWGRKGNLKSNRLLARGKTVYKNWDDVHAHVIFEPNKMATVMQEAVLSDYRIPWLGFDDLNAHLPRSLYFTHRAMWQDLSKNWNLSRAMLNVFEHTEPLKDDVATFILKDMSHECHYFNRKGEGSKVGHYEAYCWVEDIDVENSQKTIKYPIQIGTKDFTQEDVPKEEWSIYWTAKMDVTKVGVEGWSKGMKELGKTFSEIERRIKRGALAPVEN